MSLKFRKNTKYLLFLPSLLLIGGGVFWFAYTAEGVNRTWDCGGGNSSWDNDLNWSGDTEPGASDVAIFDTTCTNNVTIDKSISVAGISINAGYSGTITQSSTYTVTVGSSHFVQAAGTFTGGSGTIDINGTFTLSSGTFTSTTGTLEVGRTTGEVIFTISGGTFNHNNGTVNFNPSKVCNDCGNHTATVDIQTSTPNFYNVLVNYPNSGNGSATLTTASGDTLIATNNFTHTDGYLDGTWEVQGNVTIGAGADGGIGTLTYTGTGSKTYTYSAGGTGPHLRVNNAGVTVSAAGGTTDLKVSLFSLLAGTFTAPTGTMTIGQYTNTPETILTVSGGTFNHNNGTVAFAPSGGCASPIFTADVLTSLTLYNVTINASSGCGGQGKIATASGDTIIVTNTFTQTNGYLDGTWEVRGNCTIGTGAIGGSATLSFTGGNTQIYTDQGGNEPDGDVTINKTANGVTLASNADWNATNQDLTITAGTLLQQSSYAVATGAVTVGAGGKWVNNGTGAVTLGGAVANAGLIDFRSSNTCGGGDIIALHSSSNGVQRAWSGAGTFVMRDIEVKDQGGSAAITAYSSTNTSGNGGNWTFSGAACPAVPTPKAGVSSGYMRLQGGKVNLR